MKIWFLSTRIAGNDGVSLEAEHWKNILTKMGHSVTFIAGELDRAGILIPELHFTSPKVVELHDKVVYGKTHFRKVEGQIFELAGVIEGRLREAFNGKKPDLLIVANALSLPMHFPLAVALTRVINEFEIPTLARHHDFWWERKRFIRSSMFHFFERWFPPDSPFVKHIVINSVSRKDLQERRSIDAAIISDTFDFNTGKGKLDKYNSHFKKDFGISEDDLVFLQATRIVPRKRIELAIKIVKKLNNSRIILVIAGKAGDEGQEYLAYLKEQAKETEIRTLFIGDYIDVKRKIKLLPYKNGDPVRRRVYTLWDCYANSDIITYPSEIEGFGNQFIEAVCFKKPVIMTPYPVYLSDIKPLGFESIEVSKRIDQRDIDLIRSYIGDKEKVKNMVEKNFRLGKENFSYEATEKKITNLLKAKNDVANKSFRV